VNTVGGDEISKSCSLYTPTELQLFKKCIALIMENEMALEASSTSILNASAKLEPAPIKGKEAEKILQRLVADGWLLEDEHRGFYQLALRTIKELELYLKDLYGDVIHDCTVCQDPILNKASLAS
ncbi:Non-structural maintenance of chromosomes element 1, partial [Kappamyces sp. JEL0680]